MEVLPVIIHIVKKGDTVWSISQMYNVSPERIISDNGLYGLSSLVEGQALIILEPEIIYTVREGDTLTSIAAEFDTTVIDLIQKNPSIVYEQNLIVGQQITIKFKDEARTGLYIYGYAYTNVDETVLSHKTPFLSGCAIFSYGFTDDGKLIEIRDSHVINTLYMYKCAPFMLISSIDERGSFNSETASTVFNNKELQDKIIEKIIETMNEKGFLGLDIDFEYINPEDSEVFVEFVRNATQQLNAVGYTVNVDLAPKTSDDQQGTLYEGHNYKELGNAANTVLVMSYEWGYTYSEPMAVSPINQVRKVMEYAVSRINNSKIYMGIPNYGYNWKLPYEKGKSRATVIGNEQAIRIAADNGAVIKFDETTQSPYFNYTAQDRTKHEVWFEDIRSIVAKYGLIDELKLKGSGYWSLMRPFSQNWAYVGYRYNIDKLA